MDFPKHHALHYLPQNRKRLIDIGCNCGENLDAAKSVGVQEAVGIDINSHAISIAKNKYASDPSITLIHQSADTIPLETSTFNSAICLQVLEHIPTELRPKVIEEIARVLRQDGRFILSVPAKGLFAFLDPANYRLIFPKLFKWFSQTIGGIGREKGFSGEKHGIIWHHHFTLKELQEILSPHFDILKVRWGGCLLSPICNWLEFPFYRLGLIHNLLFKTIRMIHNWDASINWGKFLGYQLIMVLGPTK